MTALAMHEEMSCPSPTSAGERLARVNGSRPRRSPEASSDLCAHRRELRLLALRYATDEATAEDLVQDTLERALRHLGRLRPSSNLRGWLMTILRNLAVDCTRRHRRRPALEPIGPDREIPDVAAPPRPPWVEISPVALREAVEQLEMPFRRVFELYAFEACSYGEIAATLGLRKATVGTRLHRARHKLKEILERRLARA